MTNKDINELAAKLLFLADDPGARKIHGCFGITALVKRTGIGKTTLVNAKNGVSNDRLSPDHEKALANVCKFDTSWHEWHTGTADAFSKRYLGESKRRTGVALTPRYGEQERGNHRLVALKIAAVLSNSSERWPIKLGLRCRDFGELAIKMGFLDLDCGDAFARENDCSFQNGYELNGATIRVGAGTEHRPFWRIEANGGILDDVFPDEPYCIVTELAPQDTLTATFSVYVKDVSGPNEFLCRNDGRPLARNKKLLLERLAKMDLHAAADGQVVLCRHPVTFVDACAELHGGELSASSDKAGR